MWSIFTEQQIHEMFDSNTNGTYEHNSFASLCFDWKL